MGDNRRILELRRRVQADPASTSFAQLAEELRRDGANEEAVAVCRAGLAHHPDYLTARVTLGRALIEIDRLDQAFNELTFVLDAAPGNLPAIRALAEIYQRRGLMSEALVHYRRALQLAQYDVDREHSVGQIEQEMAPAAEQAEAARIEALFDFDTLVAQLGSPSPPPALPTVPPAPGIVASVELPQDDRDSFALMERQLREREEQQERAAMAAEAERRRLAVMRELETWLSAIQGDRAAHQSPA